MVFAPVCLSGSDLDGTKTTIRVEGFEGGRVTDGLGAGGWLYIFYFGFFSQHSRVCIGRRSFYGIWNSVAINGLR